MPTRLQAELFDPEGYAPGSKENFTLTFPTESGQEEAGFPLHLIKGLHPGPTLLILAAVHGDEYEGVHTVIRLCREIQPADLYGTVLLVPVTNVLAYYGVSRETPGDGRNLAREFPGKADGSVTQRLAWHLDRSLIARADFLLDLHSGGTHYAIPALVGYYHNDLQDVGRRSRLAAEAFGMEVLWAHPDTNPGRSVTAATARGVPWLYTEAHGGLRVKPEEAVRFRSGALRLMDHLGMLAEPERWIQGAPVPVRYRLMGDGNYDFAITAEREGFFIPSVQLLDMVQKGERIGAIYSWFGEELQVFNAYETGIVVGLAGTPKISRGDVIYTLTGTMG